MAHFAEIDQAGVVRRVIVAEQDFIDSGAVGDPANWVQTSYNTIAGEHKLGGEPLRKNYAGVGYTYNEVLDAFVPPKPFGSWVLNEEKCVWDSPTPNPNKNLSEGEKIVCTYQWDDNAREWAVDPATCPIE